MTTTTSYGTWVNHGDGETTIEDNVTVALGDFVDDYDVDSLTAAYRGAINRVLPDGVSLHGNEFYGPHPRADVDAAIKAAIGSVDFWAIAADYDRATADR